MPMSQFTVAEERTQCSERLRYAAGAAHVSVSPTLFARAFNVRAGVDCVTSHAVGKWIWASHFQLRKNCGSGRLARSDFGMA